MADERLTTTEFAARIKAQYPVYANVPDAELTARMLERYPIYRERVIVPDFQTETVGTTSPADEPASRLERFANWLAEQGASGDWLPAAGGAVGGVLGGIGGT